MNSDALTLVLSRRVAMAEGRNQQEAMVHTAMRLLSEVADPDGREALHLFISATPKERQVMASLIERDLLRGVEREQ